MKYIILKDGSKIEKKFFEERIKELKKENWRLKNISELGTDHLNCELTFETISSSNSNQFYLSDKDSIISVNAYEEFIK